MPKWLPHSCKVCGVERSDLVHISRQGFCDTHGMAAYLASLDRAREHGKAGNAIAGNRRPSKRS